MPSHPSRNRRATRVSSTGQPKPVRGPAEKPWQLRLPSPQQTRRLGTWIGKLATGGEILALFGELGAGKTTLVKGIAAGLRAEPTAVSSPTFTLIHEYRGRLRLVHADLYRLAAEQLEDTGLDDYLDEQTVTAVEWADRWGWSLPTDRLEIHLAHQGAAGRRASLIAIGPSAQELLAALHARWTAATPPRGAGQTRVQLRRQRRTER
ncbi:tRNA (adenosine(37)-N6)-threonylcarbamoyltransferase complex ATPase subunit type 1 TsaE [Nitrospirales bacterium NOB]|nr:MAG: tRNA threonylcarbamoyladenosine biosynthesis protein TsaE [Nitrospira sp. OLB3]MBV6468498.1 hypothetical protein [Nitrospirota bacterium]MCE7965271.1 tRNA (adenosine(37)-N6)-threonylcarbamoyltransferase complex ATPase subunit type 1 TsaE [Nitrospira sp. NTP2]MDL1890377.1 tRNA (adenosine(37)-N6)-threonylcarbamoyltransferase complex ATPase subunit type 1 TsaE [Nitrospirales bacterium NOB]RIK58583.1 MAG: tRNA (adenosine(37)-N6)-threonylcarbamoyltransferase complex ATPase subunit type 1 Tsa